jgi:hypothetical protein
MEVDAENTLGHVEPTGEDQELRHLVPAVAGYRPPI